MSLDPHRVPAIPHWLPAALVAAFIIGGAIWLWFGQ